MKKKLTALLLAAALALALAACGEKQHADTSEAPEETHEITEEITGTAEETTEAAALPAEWLALHADDILLYEWPFVLCDEGGTATVRLYGRSNGEYDYGVSRVCILWDDGREENLLASDIADDVWCADGYTNSWTEDGGLVFGDYNFDGYEDIGLQIDTPAYNLPYYYWFYDAEAGGFKPYGSWTYQLEIDEENKACICQWHSGTEYYTDTYRPDGKGGLYLAQRDTETYTYTDTPPERSTEVFDRPG